VFFDCSSGRRDRAPQEWQQLGEIAAKNKSALPLAGIRRMSAERKAREGGAGGGARGKGESSGG
jgi:hypothetical protein